MDAHRESLFASLGSFGPARRRGALAQRLLLRFGECYADVLAALDLGSGDSEPPTARSLILDKLARHRLKPARPARPSQDPPGSQA